MDPRLLKYYNRELEFVREMGGEFAREFPKIAGRLGLEGFECADPYVERLLEAFAFLAARVQLRIDAEFPRFTRHLLEMLFPHYLCPTPSMAVVRFQPDLNEGALGEGFVIPRHSVLRSRIGPEDPTPCIYRTSQDVTLYPLEITEAEYKSRGAVSLDLAGAAAVKAGIRIRIRVTAGLTLGELSLKSLPFFIRGSGELAAALHEQILANTTQILLRPVSQQSRRQLSLDRSHVVPLGFRDDQALLPYGPRSFQGYRLLQEYFAFRERFLFVELTGLESAVQGCQENELDIFLLLDRLEPTLENVIHKEHFVPFCAPAANLFPKRADRIHLTHRAAEYHVLPDRSRPLDFEVYALQEVAGHGSEADEEQEFLPFYALSDIVGDQSAGAYFVIDRRPRVVSSNQRRFGPRSSYIGSEVFISLVDEREAPYRHDLRQLSLTTLCTNRDLPLLMPMGAGDTDFTLEIGAPVDAIKCVAGPTKPQPSVCHRDGETNWRLISHLTLNYLSLANEQSGQTAAALQEMLQLYADANDPHTRNQIAGVRSIEAEPIIRPVPTPGPLSFARGLKITVTCDEAAFEGAGVFLLGAVLDQFFAKYVSINSFTETTLKSLERGEIMRWPTRIGRRQLL